MNSVNYQRIHEMIKSKKINHVLLSLFLVFITASLQAYWIRLGSWDIEHLGKDGDESAPVALAEHLHLTGLYVITFQEVYDNDDDANTKTNLQLDETMRILNDETGQDWTYEMFGNRRNGDKSQLVVIAWNQNRLAKLGETLRLDIESRIQRVGSPPSCY